MWPEERAIGGGVGPLFEKFYSVEVYDFAADHGGCVNQIFLVGRPEYNFDIAFQWKIGGGEQVHAVVAQVEGRAFNEGLAKAYLDGNGEPTTL